MNKLLIILISSATFTPYIAGMENAEKALCLVAEKTNSYPLVSKSMMVQGIISDINHSNKNTHYKEDPLTLAIKQENVEKITLLLHNKPRILYQIWDTASYQLSLPEGCIDSNGNVHSEKRTRDIISLLITNACPDDCNEGLQRWISPKIIVELESHGTGIIQEFIDNGANPDTALPLTLKQITLHNPPYSDALCIQNFEFLCEHGAFNMDALTKLEGMQEFFGSLITKLKKNQTTENK